MSEPPRTPDGRYIVVDGTLWRATRPDLEPEREKALVRDLMDARRAIGQAEDGADVTAHRRRVDEAKRALGERGPVWWNDGAPDYNRYKVENTPYADWLAEREG